MTVVDIMAILVTVVWVLVRVSEVLLEVRGRALLLTIEHVRLLRVSGVVHGHAIATLAMIVLVGVVCMLRRLSLGQSVGVSVAVGAGVAIATWRLICLHRERSSVVTVIDSRVVGYSSVEPWTSLRWLAVGDY